MPMSTGALAALSVGNTLSKYWGAKGAAKGAERQGAYEQGVYDQNAGFAEQQAADAIARGDTEAQRHMAAIRGLIGSQRAGFGAQGIDINSGSALDVQANDAAMGALDELTIRNNAAREAWGYRVQATDYGNRGRLARLGARNTAQGYRNVGYLHVANRRCLGR